MKLLHSYSYKKLVKIKFAHLLFARSFEALARFISSRSVATADEMHRTGALIPAVVTLASVIGTLTALRSLQRYPPAPLPHTPKLPTAIVCLTA